ncbi:polysulfide reductase NrfD [bacterium]|nr:polysulfide reductase NrfD [bacterium]
MTEQPIVEKKISLLTPANIITGIILVLGAIATVIRFGKGLGAVTALSAYNPWGIWIWFKLVAIALAGAGYVTCGAAYIFGMKRYHSAVRPAVLIGLLGYTLFAVSLIYDLGRPWRLPYPFVVSQGTTSVMFEIGLCVAFYLTVLFLEFSPAGLEWLGFRKIRNMAVKITILLTIFGIALSTLHQSSLGALYLSMPSKLHPLWYSSYLPVYFFITSIFGGLSMVIFVSWLSDKHFSDKMDSTYLKEKDGVVLGFGKASSLVLASYFIIRVFGVSTDNNWHYLFSGWGALFILELLGFILLPSLLFAIGAREKKTTLIKWTSVLTILGIVYSKFMVSTYAFNWQLPSVDRYFPSGLEIILTVFIITAGITAFRIIVFLMPVFHEHKDYQTSTH